MASIGDLHDDLERAVNNEDIDRAIAVQRELQNTNESLDSLYNELALAISENEYEKAKTIMRTLRDRLGTVRQDQRLTLQEALLARDKTDLSESEFETVEAMINTMGSASLERFSFFTEMIMYLSEPDSQSQTEPIERVSSMRTRSEEIEQVTDETKTVTTEADLPPDANILDIRGTDTEFRPGTSFELTLIVTNVGDSAAQGVTATLNADGDIDVSPPIVTLGSIESGAETAVKFTLTASSAGTYSLLAGVNSDNTDRSTQEATITVVDADQPQSVVDAIAGSDGVSFPELLEAIEYYNTGNSVPNTGGKQVEFQDLLQIIDRYNSNQ
jgi:hypothetical protein